MTQPLTAVRTPFSFDTEFDASGVVVSASSFRPVKRTYLSGEVEALLAQARLEARETALAEAESLQAMAMVEIAQALAGGASVLAQVAQNHRSQSAELALAAARVLSGAALDRFPAGPLQAAIEALGQEIDASPRLVVRSGGLDAMARTRIEALCTDAGFSGLVSFRDDPQMERAAFCLEWSDGRAEFDPAAAAERMGEALTAALAAEGGHAENLTDGSAL